MLMREKRAQQNSPEEDRAGNDDRCARHGTSPSDWRTRPPIYEKQDERKREIKLIFNRERPGVGECGAAMKRDVLDRQQKFPERLRHFGIFAPRRQQEVTREHGEIGRHDPQSATREKPATIEALIARQWSTY